MKFIAFALIALVAIFLLVVSSHTTTVSAAKRREFVVASAPTTTTTVKKTSCDTCQFIVTYLEKVLNSTEKNIEQEVLLLCDMVPQQYKPICTSAVAIYLPILIKKIASKDPKEACCWLSTKIYPFCEDDTCAKSKFHIQFDDDKKFKKIAPNTRDIDACSTCKLAVSIVENYLEENGTLRNEIKELIRNKACSVLPFEYRATCTMMVEEYFDIFLNNLLESFGPEVICGSIGLCPKTLGSSFVLDPSMKMMNEFEFVEDNGMGCPICKSAIGVIDGYLKRAETRESIKKFILNEGCPALPTNYVKLCEVMVGANFDLVVDSLLAKFNPELVCQQFKLCPKQWNNFLSEKQKANICTICPMAVMYLESLLLSKNAEIQSFLKNRVCARISNPFAAATCVTIVDTQYEQIVKQLLEKYNPTVVCNAIGCQQ